MKHVVLSDIHDKFWNKELQDAKKRINQTGSTEVTGLYGGKMNSLEVERNPM